MGQKQKQSEAVSLRPSPDDLLSELDWADIMADGVITMEEIEASLRAKGVDPDALDYPFE